MTSPATKWVVTPILILVLTSLFYCSTHFLKYPLHSFKPFLPHQIISNKKCVLNTTQCITKTWFYIFPVVQMQDHWHCISYFIFEIVVAISITGKLSECFLWKQNKYLNFVVFRFLLYLAVALISIAQLYFTVKIRHYFTT